MKNLIGGLFGTQENANLAYQALERSGFAGEEINMFVHKPRRRTARAINVRIQDVARNAVVGGLIGGSAGGVLGFLVGTGILPLPGLEPGLVDLNAAFLLVSLLAGIVGGGLTGMILGVASRLLRSKEQAEVVTREIEKAGVLVTVNVDGSKSERTARRVMEANEALEVGNPFEKWDLDAWTSPNEINRSLKNLADTR